MEGDAVAARHWAWRTVVCLRDVAVWCTAVHVDDTALGNAQASAPQAQAN